MGVGGRALWIRRREATQAQWWKSREGSSRHTAGTTAYSFYKC